MLKGWKYPPKIQPILDSIQPKQLSVFHGILDEKKLNRLEKWMIHKVDAEVGDFREWPSISAWMETILRQCAAANQE